MHIRLIGLFSSYEQAEATVRDLELAGIVGEEVEIISDPDRDVRAAALGMKPRETVGERIGRIFGRSRQQSGNAVYDDPGEMPNYIGEQEFYATHVRSEGAIVVVRVPNSHLAYLAEAILHKNGSKARDGKEGVASDQEDDVPHTPNNAARA